MGQHGSGASGSKRQRSLRLGSGPAEDVADVEGRSSHHSSPDSRCSEDNRLAAIQRDEPARNRRVDQYRREQHPKLQYPGFDLAGAPEACVIRVVVTLLVAVQTLLPPGTCPCQFVSFAAHAPPSHESASAPLISEDACCPACCAAAATPSAQEQVPSDRETPHEHHQHPTPGPPCSGCPVVSAGPAARMTVLTAPEQAPLDTTGRPVVLTTEATSPRTERSNLLVAPTAPPLFVRHCALLI